MPDRGAGTHTVHFSYLDFVKMEILKRRETSGVKDSSEAHPIMSGNSMVALLMKEKSAPCSPPVFKLPTSCRPCGIST